MVGKGEIGSAGNNWAKGGGFVIFGGSSVRRKGDVLSQKENCGGKENQWEKKKR